MKESSKGLSRRKFIPGSAAAAASISIDHNEKYIRDAADRALAALA